MFLQGIDVISKGPWRIHGNIIQFPDSWTQDDFVEEARYGALTMRKVIMDT